MRNPASSSIISVRRHGSAGRKLKMMLPWRIAKSREPASHHHRRGARGILATKPTSHQAVGAAAAALFVAHPVIEHAVFMLLLLPKCHNRARELAEVTFASAEAAPISLRRPAKRRAPGIVGF